MGNALCYSCSPSHEPNEISRDIIPALEEMRSMDKVEELMDYIDRILSNIGKGTQGQVGRPNSVASSIISGGNLIEKLSKRLKRHVCKKCLLSALDRQTRNAVIDVLKEAEPIPCLGMALSIAAHLLERAEQVSSNKEECLRLLRYMLTLAKHIKNLDTHLERPKLDEILCFIVKGTLMCALLMQPSRFCRFLFAPLDAADLENLKSNLLFVYPDLALEAATELFNIVSEVSSRLPIVPGSSQGEYPQDAVGLEDTKNAVTKLLDLTESSIRVVVIYGVGGIGKTTLATAVFKSLDLTGYHYCRVDMDQDCRNIDLQAMQKQILSDVFEKNMEVNNCTKGREKLSEAFGNASRSVFLFIDNALKETDLDMLLPIQYLSRLPMQSRILLTTRNLSETKIFELQGRITTYPFRVDSLPELEAKKLLCHYALGDKNGIFDKGVDMDGLLQVCGRIPLVLRIVGCHLRSDGNTVSACNKILEYYKEWQQKGVEGGGEDLSERMVDSVYRRLKEPSQEAFLDISFFFYDWERSKVEDIVGEVQLKDLERAALITTCEEDIWTKYGYKVKQTVVKVHDIVRARGRKLSEGKRIIDRDSLSTLLRDEQKLQQTKGVCLRDNYNDTKEFSVQAKHVDLMSRSLRVLSLGNNTRINGLCESAFEELRFLRIFYEDMLPIQLTNSKQLVCFDGHLMRGRESHLMRELKFPELPMSSRLLEFHAQQDFPPVSLDFKGHLTALREIDLCNINLANFENGNRQLKSLRHLLLEKCEGFTSIPESLENFSCLKILSLHNCSMLKRLPGSFGNLSSLQYLHIRFCLMFERFPESIGNLSSLQRLDTFGCSKLERFPESIGDLSSLQTLNTSRCSKLERFPESIGNLSSLQRLNTSDCSKLERLPQTFDQLSCLQTLEVDGCEKMCSIFDSFGQLRCLKFLSIRNCKELKRIAEDTVCLPSLAGVRAYGCAELEAKAMDSLVMIKSLMFLEMGESPKLIKRWEEIQQHNPTIGAALRFGYRKYPYEDIMSRMFFCGERRFVGVDSDGQLVEVASSSFPDVGEKVGVLLTACDISNAVRERVMEVASSGFQIICVDVGVEWQWEAEGSSWMEERDHRIKKTLLQLPQRSRAWTSLSHKTTLLFAYSLWHFAFLKKERIPDTLIVGTSVLVDEEGRRRLSSLDIEYSTDRSKYSGGVELGTLFYPLLEVANWMTMDYYEL